MTLTSPGHGVRDRTGFTAVLLALGGLREKERVLEPESSQGCLNRRQEGKPTVPRPEGTPLRARNASTDAGCDFSRLNTRYN